MVDTETAVDERRVVTLNIQHGGGGVRLKRLLEGLANAGYATCHPEVGPTENSVLIASRGPIGSHQDFDAGLNARHLLSVDLGWTVLCGVYMPLNSAKLPYWEALIADARRDGVGLLIGDFNTGTNDLDKDPKGTRFIGPEMPGRLIASGYEDVWRSRHPGVREYSWFSPGVRNGFRLDYAFAAPELARSVTACEFDQTPREHAETDHAALVVSMTK